MGQVERRYATVRQNQAHFDAQRAVQRHEALPLWRRFLHRCPAVPPGDFSPLDGPQYRPDWREMHFDE